MKKILLVITGSIAAYKALDLIRLFKKNNYLVTSILTKSAKEFITPLLVTSISGSKTYEDLFCPKDESEMGHINLSRQNDLIIVAPASANFIAKMANGIGDDLASTTLLAANKPIFVAPAMNEKMWQKKQNQKNLQFLREEGVKILTPEVDILACGEFGMGKMTDPNLIFDEIDNFFNTKKTFSGKKIIISTGATFEPLDPVRFIGNYSSGKQGIAIAETLYNLGADVLLVAGNVAEEINLPKKNIVRVKTADEMLSTINENLCDVDIFISAAAVADFKPKTIAPQKIKKSIENPLNAIELVENVDILKTIGNSDNRPKIVIGFAAESENLLENAQNKLKIKNCDLIVANNIERGAVFGSSYNKVAFLHRNGIVKQLKTLTKVEIAELLVQEISSIL